ncbi:MAG: hypothetical protein N3G19_00910 [Candidatus Pacearchaeota archaeon]|nr:hypothetical protein [Candidatus Pacearchaeota archaeon]
MAFILLMTISLIFVSGQQGCKKEEKTTFNTTALVARFIDGAPPSQLIPGEKYKIYAEIRNVGGYDVAPGNAHFFLSGIGENLKNVNLHLQNFNLLNKKTAMQEGGKEQIVFANNAEVSEKLGSLPAPFNFNIRLDSCYKYATMVQTEICVGRGDNICSVAGEKIVSGSNSAAPLQVTSLTESVQGNKLYVTFLIENKWNGEVYLPNADCVKIQEQNIDEKLKQNRIELAVDTEEGFSCKLQSAQPPHGTIDGLSGIASIGTITCQKTLTEAAGHKTPFRIILSYVYRESITKGLTILPP